MPKLIFTSEEINDFLKGKREVYGPFYERSIVMAEDIMVHSDGTYPSKLIDERRPNEPLEVKDYRKKIFKPKTKGCFSKVNTSLQKIRRSQDWSIRYDNTKQFTRIADNETLEWYTDYNYPFFTSLTNWIFTIGLRKYLIDPNAVVFVYPLSYEVVETEYIQPFGQIFDSANVLYFEPEDYAILKIPEGCVYYTTANKPVRGFSMYVVTTKFIARYNQVSTKNFELVLDYTHGLDMLPVFKMKGVLIDQSANQFLYESRISGMIPELDEAVREYSDLQAGVVNHLYLERYEYTQTECLACKGTGLRRNPSWFKGCDFSETITCNAAGCNHGYIVPGPFSKTILRPQENLTNMQPAPWPPIGFVQKDVEILKVQDTRVQDHIYNAYAAVNMEFLADSPLSQSGVAKEVDRQELDSFCNSVAEDLVALMDSMYRTIARYRYQTQYIHDDIEDMLPVVSVPEKFDILSTNVALKEVTDAKTAKVNPVLLGAMEEDYASKRFNAEPEIRDRVALVLTLDPLPNITDDDKMTRLSNKGITIETYIISSNIQSFVQRAIDDNNDFAGLKLSDQRAVLIEYAKEQIDASASVLIPDLMNGVDNIYGQPI